MGQTHNTDTHTHNQFPHSNEKAQDPFHTPFVTTGTLLFLLRFNVRDSQWQVDLYGANGPNGAQHRSPNGAW